MVQVNGKIEFNDQVQSIKFSNNTVPNGVDVQFFGWGRTEVSEYLFNAIKLHTITIYFLEKKW